MNLFKLLRVSRKNEKLGFPFIFLIYFSNSYDPISRMLINPLFLKT